MFLSVICPGCDREQRVHAATRGKSTRCRFCAHEFTVEEAGGQDPAPRPHRADIPRVVITRKELDLEEDVLEVLPGAAADVPPPERKPGRRGPAQRRSRGRTHSPELACPFCQASIEEDAPKCPACSGRLDEASVGRELTQLERQRTRYQLLSFVFGLPGIGLLVAGPVLLGLPFGGLLAAVGGLLLWVGIGFAVAYKRYNRVWMVLGGLVGAIPLIFLPDERGADLARLRRYLRGQGSQRRQKSKPDDTDPAAVELEPPLREAVAPVLPAFARSRPRVEPDRPSRSERAPITTDRTPGYLFGLALLPLGMMLVTLGAAWGTGRGLGWALAVGLGGGGLLAVLCLLVALLPMSVALRVVCSVGLTGLGYLGAFAFVLVLLLVGSLGPVGDADWKDFSSEAGQFRVQMPGTPKPRTETAAAPPLGNITTYLFAVERDWGNLAFIAGYADFHLRPGMVFDSQKALAGGRDGAVASIRGRVVRETPITLSGHPGLELELQSAQATIVCRYYMVRHRLYQVMVVSTKGRPNDADVQKFFASFRLTGPTPAPGVKPPPPRPPVPPLQPPPMPEEPRPSPRDRRPPAATEVPGLIGYWCFEDDGPRVADLSSGGSHGTLHGARKVKGLAGQSARFNGSGDYFDYGSGPGLNFGADSPFTFAGWVQTTRSTGTIVSQRNSRRGAPVIDLLIEGGHLSAIVRDDQGETGEVRVRGGRVDDRSWHHFALIRRAGGTVELFLDGAPQGKAVGARAAGPITTDLRAVGCERHWVQSKAAAHDASHLQGWVDEFCIYNRPLREPEVKALAGRGPVPTPEPEPREPMAGSRTLQGHVAPVSFLAFTADSQTLVSVDRSSSIRLWDPATGQNQGTLTGAEPALAACLAPDGKTLTTAGAGRGVRLWDLAARGEGQPAVPLTRGVTPQSVSWSPDGRTIALGQSDRLIRLWDAAAGQERGTLKGHTSPLVAVAFSPDGTVLASQDSLGRIKLWDTAARRELATLVSQQPPFGGSHRIRALVFSPDGRTLTSASEDGLIKLWDVGARQQRAVLRHERSVASVAFSPGGRWLATACADGMVRVWDAAAAKPVDVIKLANASPPGGLGFSPDGKYLAVASGSQIAVWETDKVLKVEVDVPAVPLRPVVLPPSYEVLPRPPRLVGAR